MRNPGERLIQWPNTHTLFLHPHPLSRAVTLGETLKTVLNFSTATQSGDVHKKRKIKEEKMKPGKRQRKREKGIKEK